MKNSELYRIAAKSIMLDENLTPDVRLDTIALLLDDLENALWKEGRDGSNAAAANLAAEGPTNAPR